MIQLLSWQGLNGTWIGAQNTFYLYMIMLLTGKLKPFGWIEEPEYSEIKKIMPLPCVDLLIIKDNSVLLLKRNNSPAKGEWFTPGSRVLLNETLEEAVIRTLQEETGLALVKAEQMGAMTQVFKEHQTVTVFYRVDVLGGDVIMNEEHCDYKWIKNTDEDLHPYVEHMIKVSKIFN
jgi:ADP-ribose pyrophosphatase YjhB (NUDIX family)